MHTCALDTYLKEVIKNVAIFCERCEWTVHILQYNISIIINYRYDDNKYLS